MFDNLKKAFTDVSKGFSEKDLKEKDIEDVLFEFEINLLESDVATEVIDSIKESLKDLLKEVLLYQTKYMSKRLNSEMECLKSN